MFRFANARKELFHSGFAASVKRTIKSQGFAKGTKPMLNDVLYFPILISSEKDSLGQVEKNVEFSRVCFCYKKSISQSEFYAAGQAGFKPDCVFVVNTLDYQDEKKVKFKGVEMDVYRTFDRLDERTELYCKVKASD